MQMLDSLLTASDEDLAHVDPLVMNLLVAKSIPSLSELDISHYQELTDQWAEGIRQRLPRAEAAFRKSPQDWKNDLRFVRLAVLCEYVDRELGIVYREDQKDLTAVAYIDPTDLFLNGVIDTRRGTCSNMSALHVALGWRLGWPVSLANVGFHHICRYDDGEVTHNIEATLTGVGGFSSPSDGYYIEKYRLTPRAISSGSDLRMLKPRELLGVFIGARARHMRDTGKMATAEVDYLTARSLYPCSRYLYLHGVGVSIARSVQLFEEEEKGHPSQLAVWLGQEYGNHRLPVNHQHDDRSNAARGIVRLDSFASTSIVV